MQEKISSFDSAKKLIKNLFPFTPRAREKLSLFFLKDALFWYFNFFFLFHLFFLHKFPVVGARVENERSTKFIDPPGDARSDFKWNNALWINFALLCCSCMQKPFGAGFYDDKRTSFRCCCLFKACRHVCF